MRPLRQFLPERAYLITARCFEERFFLAPDSRTVTNAVAICLAQAAAKYGLQVFAYVAMSNHLHLIVRAPRGGLPDAMQLFFSQVARRINLLRGRKGPVFSDRYHHQTICDDAALRNAVRYVLLNPERAGAATSASTWHGLSSFDDTCNNSVLLCTKRVRAGEIVWLTERVQRKDIDHRLASVAEGNEEHLVLACHSAALLGEGGAEAHRKFVDSLLAEDLELRRRSQSSLGQIPSAFERPVVSKRSRAPSCIASTTHARKAYIAERRAFVAAYRTASARFRRGEDARFPPGCCLPWPSIHMLVGCSDTS